MNTKIEHSIHKKDMLLKQSELKQQTRQRQDDALKEVKRLAVILVEEFEIEKVWLVGPLTYGEYREGMTLELALEGIPDGVYAKAFASMKQISSYAVELLDLQQADSWTKRSIRTSGRLLATNS